jgi:hypothetical protein
LGVRLTNLHHKKQIVQKPDSLEIEKNGGRLFRRPKLTLTCSAEGKERRKTADTSDRNSKKSSFQTGRTKFRTS